MRHMSVNDQVGYLVKRLQQQIRAELDEALSRHRVTMSAYAALAVLKDAPGLSNAELARRCFVTPQTMNRIIQSLNDEGIVDRPPDPNHGRILQTRLTPAGERLLENCHGEVNALHTRMLANLNGTEQALLADLLRRCIHALEA